MFHGAPRGLQQKPMLWVHQPDLARRHTEERRVKARHVIDETRTTGHDLAGRTGFGVEEFVDIPPILWHLRYRVPTLAQHVPKLVRVPGTRETSCIANDCKPRGSVERMSGGSHMPLFSLHRRSERHSAKYLSRLKMTLPQRDTIACAPVACVASLSGGQQVSGDCCRREGMLTQQRVMPDSESAIARVQRGSSFAHRENHGRRTR